MKGKQEPDSLERKEGKNVLTLKIRLRIFGRLSWIRNLRSSWISLGG